MFGVGIGESVTMGLPPLIAESEGRAGLHDCSPSGCACSPGGRLGGSRSYLRWWSPGEVETGGEVEEWPPSELLTRATGRDMGGGGGYMPGE